MFLETQPQGQPVKEKKPSELLREGIPHVKERSNIWLEKVDGEFCGCAVGTMAYAAGMRSTKSTVDWAHEVLGDHLYTSISWAMSSGASREEIAKQLEAEGR